MSISVTVNVHCFVPLHNYSNCPGPLSVQGGYEAESQKCSSSLGRVKRMRSDFCIRLIPLLNKISLMDGNLVEVSLSRRLL